MSQDACPLPNSEDDEDAAARRMLTARRIAVVGLSDDPGRPSYGVARYLQSVGKEIIPVNPNCATVLGLRSFPSLAAVPGPIEVVDIFRRPEFCADLVREAIASGGRG